jgi:hypothetical protein
MLNVGFLVMTTGSLLGLEGPIVWVSVYNDAHLEPKIMLRAEGEAVRVFKAAGFRLICTDGRGSYQRPSEDSVATHLFIRIMPDSKDLNEDTFGVSFLGENGHGIFADIFVGPAEKLSEDYKVSLAAVLGHVMAHEVGHLLLGFKAHSSQGIMRPHWQREELVQAAMGRLRFTDFQADVMQQTVRQGQESGTSVKITLREEWP